MISTSTPWEPWEYRVLHQNKSFESVAKALKRDIRDIQAHCQYTMDDWYERNRCPGSPLGIRRLMKLAKKIWTEDFREFVSPDELVVQVYEALQESFRYFQPLKVNTQLTTEKGFLVLFRRNLKRSLRKLRLDVLENRQKYRKLEGELLMQESIEYHNSKFSHQTDVLSDWGLGFICFVQHDFNSQQRAFAKLRLYEENSVDQIAELSGISRATFYRKFNEQGYIQNIQESIRQLPVAQKMILAQLLMDDVGMPLSNAASLLLISESELSELLMQVNLGKAAQARSNESEKNKIRKILTSCKERTCGKLMLAA